MLSFTNLPIKWKLTLVVTLTCCIALSLVSAAFIATEVVSLRRSFLRDISTLAEVIGTNASVALTFEDPKSANQILATTGARPDIVAVRLYTRRGEVLGSFDRAGGPRGGSPVKPERDTQRFERSHLVVFRTVRSEGEPIGTVFIEAEFAEMPSRLKQIAITGALVMLAAGLVSLGISYRLQRVVSEPILGLAEAAAEIGKGRLGTRIEVTSSDEIGTLGRAFNQMAAGLSETTVSKGYVDKILQSMEDMLIVTAPDGTIRTWNAAALRMLGYTPDELANVSIAAVLDAGLPSAEALEKIVQETLGSHIEQQYRARDGRRIPVSLSASIMRDDEGAAQGFVFVAQDITERKRTEEELRKYYDEVEESRRRAEEQAEELARQAEELTAARNSALEATRLKSEFLANMSHEIRTPMNGIIGMTQLALETGLSPEQREYLEMVSSSAHSLLGLLNDILDFSKIEAGRLDIEVIAFTLRSHLTDTLKPLAVRAAAKELEVAWEIDSDVPDDLKGDPSRFRQVLVNLVGNAIKFTESGGIKVTVSAQSRGPNEVVLRFDVADTGIGIPADKRGVIFEAFRKVDGSTSRRYGGTGLGLAISSQLVTMMGGRIWVDSEAGKGSIFHFTASFGIPRTAAREPSSAPPDELHRRTGRNGSASDRVSVEDRLRLRVLLAEDNPVNRALAIRLLEKRGHSVRSVGDGTQAVAAYREGRFDLILMDLQMPEMDGFEATRAIRALERAAGERIPILALTAHAMKGDRERCLAADMDGYLTKPIEPGAFYQALEAFSSRTGEDDGPPESTALGPRDAALPGDRTDSFDSTALLANAGGERSLVAEIVGLFLEECPKLMAAIRAGARRGDAPAVRSSAHRLKGSLGVLAAKSGLAVAQRLEERARAGEAAGIDEAIGALEKEMKTLTLELEALTIEGVTP